MKKWISVCLQHDLNSGAGICALLGDEQVAVFQCRQTQALYAVSNYDPIGKANVISRGIMGSIKEEAVVSSPLYKQHFNLSNGLCLQEPDRQLKTYPIRLHGREVQLAYG
ncbi:nitrite reductase small subunit NirD [Shewanella surugensis]|uniref:Nitrite reductase small subunit NirD n=1 Tax=Shewanella surugensis TaxID=212020 RepID=A0ABT0LBK8_9GAMM|nr:nitrite reductase small subunit NirD [Shewanella surugensis]MCL1125078.1 nitrite reductase small subunit NirD [Shewanella surugensis]